MSVSSYGDATQSSVRLLASTPPQSKPYPLIFSTLWQGTVRVLLDLRRDIADKDVLIVEDIIDSGLTAKNLLQLLEVRRPKSLAGTSFPPPVGAYMTFTFYVMLQSLSS